MNSLNSRIKWIMNEHGLSYQSMADIAGVSSQTVYNWLSGSKIKEENAKKIATNLGYDWWWLAYGNRRESDSLLEAAKLLIRTSGGISALFRGYELYYVEATEAIVRFSGTDRDRLAKESFYSRMLSPSKMELEQSLRNLVSRKINAYHFMTQRESGQNGTVVSLLITVLHLAGLDSEMPYFQFIGMPISNSEGLSPSEVLEVPMKNITDT